MLNALEAIAQRKSVRSYRDDMEINAYQIDELMKAAGSAPNAGPFHITLVLNKKLIQEVNDKALKAMKKSDNEFLMQRASLPEYQPLYGAPILMLFSAPATDPYGIENTSNAATCAAIAATALNLGSCYVITPTLALDADPDLEKALGIPEKYKARCGLLVGYEGENNYSGPRHAEYTANTCE